jgi:ABC-type microcin C transport system duplicated ATPase subunit YejF
VQAASPFGHGLKLDRALADEVIVRRNGRVMEQGLGAHIFDDPQTG